MMTFSITLILFLLDCKIKNTIEQNPRSYWRQKRFAGIFSLDRLHNNGLAMGFLKKHPLLTKLIPILILLILLILYYPLLTAAGFWGSKIGLGLLIGGACGNIYDRFKRGYVVDYFHLPLPKIQHIVFNLSDIGIFLGVLFLLASL